jgi:cytochrome c553
MKAQYLSLLAVGLLSVPFSAYAGDAALGKEKSTTCAACHGVEGTSASNAFPHLAGQHEDYLYRALLDYQVGNRKNPIMAAQVEKLSRADLADLAAYFASKKGLYVRR